jgi:hypothetical protein
LIPELVGRLPVVATLEDLDEASPIGRDARRRRHTRQTMTRRGLSAGRGEIDEKQDQGNTAEGRSAAGSRDSRCPAAGSRSLRRLKHVQDRLQQ